MGLRSRTRAVHLKAQISKPATARGTRRLQSEALALWRARGRSAAQGKPRSLLSTLHFESELPLWKTTAGKAERRLSARSFRATRRNARSARATKSGTCLSPLVFRFAFMIQSTRGRNLHHQSQKRRGVLRGSRGCPRSPAPRERKLTDGKSRMARARWGSGHTDPFPILGVIFCDRGCDLLSDPSYPRPDAFQLRDIVGDVLARRSEICFVVTYAIHLTLDGW